MKLFKTKNCNMKKSIVTFVFTVFFSLFVVNGFCQDPPPPPGGGHGQTGNQNGGNAPIGSGMVISLLLGLAYGTKKSKHIFQNNSQTN